MLWRNATKQPLVLFWLFSRFWRQLRDDSDWLWWWYTGACLGFLGPVSYVLVQRLRRLWFRWERFGRIVNRFFNLSLWFRFCRLRFSPWRQHRFALLAPSFMEPPHAVAQTQATPVGANVYIWLCVGVNRACPTERVVQVHQ